LVLKLSMPVLASAALLDLFVKGISAQVEAAVVAEA